MENTETPELVQIVNWTDPGILKSASTKIFSTNSKYYCYCCFTSVVIRDIKTLDLVEEVAFNMLVPSTVALSSDDEDLLAISASKANNVIFSVSQNTIINSFQTPETIISMGWVHNSQEIVLFSSLFCEMFIYNIQTKTLRQKFHLFENMRVLDTTTDIYGNAILVGGNALGTVQLATEFEMSNTNFSMGSPVVCVQFDPLNKENCLVVSQTGSWTILLINKDSMKKVNSATSQLNVSSASWLPFKPGHFITGDANMGVIKIWNVANQMPIDSISLSQYGVVEVCSLTEGNIFCSFQDGTIIVYNLEKRKKMYESRAPHSKMISNISFLPTDENIMCTVSVDGTYCLWNLQEMSLIDIIESPDTETTITCTDISPGSGILVSGGNHAMLYVISMKTKELLYSCQIYQSQYLIANVSINKYSPNEVLVVSKIGNSFIFDIEHKGITWTGPTNVICGYYSPYKEDLYILATAESELIIYEKGDERRYKVTNEKIYNIIFSPHKDTLIAILTYGGSIIIVDISKYITEKPGNDKKEHILMEFNRLHKGTAYCGTFHPMIDDFLFIGGGDKMISVLNINSKTVLTQFQMHNSIISSIAIPPLNPLLLISTSTDSTLRFLSLDRIFSVRQMANIINFIQKTDPNDLKKSDEQREKEMISWLTPMKSTHQLLNMVHRLKKDKKVTVKKGDIQHYNDLIRLNDKYVSKLLKSKGTSPSIIKQAIVSREKTKEAARMELQAGNIKKYCELMFVAGEREKALAAAPAVSVDFWKQMVKNMIKVSDDENEKVTYSLAIGNVDAAIDYSNEYNDKILISLASLNHSFSNKVVRNPLFKNPSTTEDGSIGAHVKYIDIDFQSPDLFMPYTIARRRSKKLLEQGEIYDAAIAFLAIGDVVSAVELLAKHGQIITSFVVHYLLGLQVPHILKRYAEVSLRRIIFPQNYPQTYEAYINVVNTLNILNLPKFPQTEREYQQATQELIEYAQNEFVKRSYDIIALEEKIYPLTLIPLYYSTKSAYIIFISLFISFHKAVWKGYYPILERILLKMECQASKIGMPTNEDGHNWVSSAYNCCSELFKLIPAGSKATIEAVGRKNHNSTNFCQWWLMQPTGQSYFIGERVVSYEYALMWLDVSPYQIQMESTQFMFI